MNKKTRLTALAIVLCLFLGLLAACETKKETAQETGGAAQTEKITEVAATETTAQPAAEETEQAETRIFTDLQGNEIEIPADVQKVIHLWPASTALHVFLGTSEKIYGTLGAVQKGWGWLTSACPRLLEVQGFAGDATAEELLKLEPDVVITPNKDLAAGLNAQGVPTACMLAGEDLESLKTMILAMGELLGEEESERAKSYITYLDEVNDRVSAAVSAIPEEERVVVYYNSAQHGESPLLTCGDGSIVETWMNTTGVINAVAGKVDGMDKEVNMEVIVEADPDWIVVGGTHQDAAWETIMNDPAWQELAAVKEGRIIRNPQGVMKWEKFGVEIALQMQWFVEQVYPGTLDTDIEKTVKDFYRDYYDFELTDELYDDLLAGRSAPR